MPRIRAIRRIKSAPKRVYNVRVAKNHNYFASGVLVHNCDDPHNLAEIYSDPLRDTVLRWWDEAMSNRVEDVATSALLIVMQRAHYDDLIGHVLSKELGYDYLCLPARYEQTDRITSIGWVDPRKQYGELLWAERFPDKELALLERQAGASAVAQYQQQPIVAGGGMFRKQDWRFWYPHGERSPEPVKFKNEKGEWSTCHQMELPSVLDQQAQSWDLSFKDTEESDFVVGQVWGVSRANRFLLNQIRAQMDINEVMRAIKALAVSYPDAHAILIEDKANGPAVIQMLQDQVSGLIAVDPQGGKMSRAVAAQPSVQSGNCYLPHPDFADFDVYKFIEEHAQFPKGKNDDQVDAHTQAANYFRYGNAVELWGGGVDDYVQPW